MDEITTFNTAVVAADQALTDAQAAAQEHGNLSDEYWQALSAQYDAAQAVVAAFGVAYGDDDGPPSDQVQQAMQDTRRLFDQVPSSTPSRSYSYDCSVAANRTIPMVSSDVTVFARR